MFCLFEYLPGEAPNVFSTTGPECAKANNDNPHFSTSFPFSIQRVGVSERLQSQFKLATKAHLTVFNDFIQLFQDHSVENASRARHGRTIDSQIRRLRPSMAKREPRHCDYFCSLTMPGSKEEEDIAKNEAAAPFCQSVKQE